jgi:hypothetical protein
VFDRYVSDRGLYAVQDGRVRRAVGSERIAMSWRGGVAEGRATAPVALSSYITTRSQVILLK